MQPSLFGATNDAPPVRVVRSARRRRTVEARMIDGVLEVHMPARATKADELHYIDLLRAKFERTQRSTSIDLTERAAQLARRYRLPEPVVIRWVSNMEQRWGSCTKADGAIRISDRVSKFPAWVLDAVIVHELAHLVRPDHSAEFWELANRYPRMERARGYLMCASGGSDDE
jgi:predicted metal-dependent hydrolase